MFLEQSSEGFGTGFSRTTLLQVGISESISESRASGFFIFRPRQCCYGGGVIEPCAHGGNNGWQRQSLLEKTQCNPVTIPGVCFQ
jgi:hypothetical protein